MILKFDFVSLGMHENVSKFEIPPVHVVDNKWVPASQNNYIFPEIKDLIEKSSKKWTKKVVDQYKKAHEADIIANYADRTLTDEQFAQILAVLPNHLFEPNQTFIDKMIELFQGRKIIECGAGNGHTGKILSDAGFDVTCIDINPPELCEYPVTKADALTYKFKNAVCLICRPDEAWLDKTITNATKAGCPVICVRKKHVSGELIAENVGSDGEYMYKIEL
jgi:hypothetical protein